jgi:hypothetical protein
MKYIFIFCLCLVIEPLFAQIYVGGSFGAGIAQTSQIAFNIKTEEKTINTYTHTSKFIVGYTFRKRKIKLETGVGLAKYTSIFNHDDSYYDHIDRTEELSFIPFAIPLTLKCKLDIRKPKKTEYYAKVGIIHYTNAFFKDKLKSPPAFIANNRKIELQYYYLSRTKPGDFNTFLINFGLELKRSQFKKGYLTFGLEVISGLHTITNAHIVVAEKKDDVLVNNDLFSIDTDGTCQLFYIGYVF